MCRKEYVSSNEKMKVDNISLNVWSPQEPPKHNKKKISTTKFKIYGIIYCNLKIRDANKVQDAFVRNITDYKCEVQSMRQRNKNQNKIKQSDP